MRLVFSPAVLRSPLFLGLCITLLQVVSAILLQPSRTPLSAYGHLFAWDSAHYGEITRNGYRSSLPPPPLHRTLDFSDYIRDTNVAFFPGYPLAGSLIHAVTRLPISLSLLIVAQLAAWWFWTLLILLLRRWQLSNRAIALTVGMLLAYPSSFFLIAAYSESLFLAGLCGLIYWSTSGTAASGTTFASLHGMVMSATRIFGLPLSIYPLLAAATRLQRNRYSWTDLRRAILITCLASTGALLFFLYCHLAFGHWNLYLQRQRMGWVLESDYFFFLKRHWRLFVPMPGREGWLEANFLSRVSASLMLYLLILLPIVDLAVSRQRITEWRERVPLYLLAWLQYYLLAVSLVHKGMASMIRYTFVVFLFLALAAAHLLHHAPIRSTRLQKFSRALIAIAASVGLSVQVLLIQRFTQEEWVG